MNGMTKTKKYSLLLWVWLFSQLADAHTFDFEDISVEETDIGAVALRNFEDPATAYGKLVILEGFVFDDSKFNQKWQELFPGKQFHPSKSQESSSANQALISQSLSFTGSQVVLCRFSVAEKLNPLAHVNGGSNEFVNVGDVRVRYSDEEITFELDQQVGYQLIELEIDEPQTEIVVSAIGKEGKPAQLIFDDFKISNSAENCSR